jgi:undecaprenyl-diphosphatase
VPAVGISAHLCLLVTTFVPTPVKICRSPSSIGSCMSPLHAIVLGLTQGLTEFLPVSSSGHLLVVPWLFGWEDFDKSAAGLASEKAFDVALHIGTFVAAVAYFRKDLIVYIRDGVKAVVNRKVPPTLEGKLAWLLVVSSLPAALIGAVLEDKIDSQLGKVPLIGVSLILFGLLLGWADRLRGKRKLEEYTMRDALIIGAAQILALNPGTSRSGITITAGRAVGFNRDAAARASFLMALPVTGGAIALKMVKLAQDGIPAGLKGAMVLGIITAGISGWLAVWGTLKLVRTKSFTPFVIYRVVAGFAVLAIYSGR